MKKLLDLLTRLLTLVALTMAAVPSGATEMVCVLGNGKVIVPVAACKMACCAHCTPATTEPSIRSCCAQKQLTASRPNLCSLAGRSCRCELRFVQATHPVVAAASNPAPHAWSQLAILTIPSYDLPLWVLVVSEPGIFGIDSGPPRKRSRTPQQTRAPPVFSI